MGSCFGLLARRKEEESHRASGMEISGSVALITGGARGLGRGFAEKLLEKGGKVCLADIDGTEGAKTLQELQATHGADNVHFVVCDVTKDEDFKGAWDSATDKLGPVTLLINNAGVGNEQNWKLTIDVNLGGCIRGTYLALERMGTNKGGPGGTVVNISSIAALRPNPFGPAYAATKSGIVALSRSLGHDFHFKISGVRVQVLCPTLVDTDFLASSLKHVFSPEVAQALPQFSRKLKKITVETVANALIQLLEEGKNGGCMSVEADKEPYYVDASIP